MRFLLLLGVLGCSEPPHEKYVDPSTVETPIAIKPACIYKYSHEVQMYACPEPKETADDTNL